MPHLLINIDYSLSIFLSILRKIEITWRNNKTITNRNKCIQNKNIYYHNMLKKYKIDTKNLCKTFYCLTSKTQTINIPSNKPSHNEFSQFIIIKI